MNTSKLKIFIGGLLLFCSLNLFAATIENQPPVMTLKTSADKILVELDKNRTKLKNNDVLIHQLIRNILLPRFDVETMSRAVVGREYWQAASDDLRRIFVKEFTRYVIRTYAAAIANYDGEKMQFFPIRDYEPNATRVQVNSNIVRKNGPAIKMSYRVYKKANTWVTYDFSVEGISIVQNYRAQFANTLQNGGLAALVRQIQAENK